MQKHWPLILGVGVPALFLLAVLGFALLPKLGKGPSHDILFTENGDGSNYGRGTDYIDRVVDGKIARTVNEGALLEWRYDVGESRQVRREPNPDKAGKLYRYSVADESLKEISLAEAKKLSLDAGPSSDDGFSVGNANYYYNDGIFELFGSRSSRAGRLPIYRDGKVVDEVVLPTESGYYYDGNLLFLAWIQ